MNNTESAALKYTDKILKGNMNLLKDSLAQSGKDNEELKEKVKNTNIEIYGAKTFAESKLGKKYFEENKELLVKKTEEGIFKKFGVKNYQQSEEYQNKKDEILEKRKETKRKK